MDRQFDRRAFLRLGAIAGGVVAVRAVFPALTELARDRYGLGKAIAAIVAPV